MIEIQNLEKSFEGTKAVNGITLSIREKQVFGLIGTNGAGKSTLLRMLCGVLRPDSGSVTIDGKAVYDAPEVKKELFFISDDPYFFRNGTAGDMEAYYSRIYPAFDRQRFSVLLKDFGLERDRRISNYSKGMKKQLSVILGLCTGTKYLVCDETFDGLDPVMRQSVKSIFAGDMLERGLTPIIASHNLRELEDICDHVGLLHRGGVLLSEDLLDMKLGIQKVQVVFVNEADAQALLRGMQVMNESRRGRLHTYTIRGERKQIEEEFAAIDTLFFEMLPLTLEEIFISETEVAGYDVKKFILN